MCLSVSLGLADTPSFGPSFCARQPGMPLRQLYRRRRPAGRCAPGCGDGAPGVGGRPRRSVALWRGRRDRRERWWFRQWRHAVHQCRSRCAGEQRGFGHIGMQFQNSPVSAPITNVHISNEGNNNSNNTIVGDNNVINNANFGITINV
jgi:hypothetical protein